jgi:transcriptional regulator with XRE-family HTH domain
MSKLLRSENEIRELRKRLKMTQQELADNIGIDVMTVSRWERGIYRPSRLALQAILKLTVQNV